MQIYSKHLIMRVAIYSMILSIALTGVLWITQSVRVMDLIVNKGIKISDFLMLSAYLLPSLMFIIMPIATLGATISILSKANHDKEIIVLKSFGLSTFQIMKPFIYSALLFTALGYVFSLYLLPKSYQEFKHLQSFLRNHYASTMLEEGVFSDKINDFIIYIEKREKNNSFSNIFAYSTKQQGKAITIIAEKGKIDNDTSQFIVQNGVHQEHNLSTNQITMMTFDHYTIDISFLYEYLESKRILEPTERFVHELFNIKDAEVENKNKFISNAHQRLVWPIFCLGFTVFASYILITRTYSRSPSWKKNIPLISISITILALSVMLQNLSLQYIRCVWLMYVNAAIPFILTFYSNRKFHL